MIGNDIVDVELAKVQSNWQRKGFLKKVFTFNEQLLILSTAKPDLMVWRLWSMKESAYKSWLRMRKIVKLNPISFECELLDDTRGVVFCDQDMYHTISEINDDFIHTYAVVDHGRYTLSFSVTDLDQNLTATRSFYDQVIDELEIKMRWNGDELEIVKNGLGIPELYREGERLSNLCSLSHHGRFGSYLISN